TETTAAPGGHPAGDGGGAAHCRRRVDVRKSIDLMFRFHCAFILPFFQDFASVCGKRRAASQRRARSLFTSVFYSTVCMEHRQLFQKFDVTALCGLTLRQDGHSAGDGAARQGHQLFHGVKGTAGGDHIVHQQDPLAPDQLRIVPAQIQPLGSRGGDGGVFHVDRIRHICLGTLSCDEILLRTGLAGHLMNQG
ncbi:Methylphosphotriester-DNA--protein-cysteine S-methyltransferase, partial [Dysosmobacter welbionis]